MKKISWRRAALFVGLLAVAGCSTTITNLTPSTMTRQSSGLYPFEADIQSNQQSLRKQTIEPYVLIGPRAYPMQPTLQLPNRWETLIPIPPDREFVNYQFKVNYEYNSIPRTALDSRLSHPYQLHILDRAP